MAKGRKKSKASVVSSRVKSSAGKGSVKSASKSLKGSAQSSSRARAQVSTYKGKAKGTRYIARLLGKYYKRRYATIGEKMRRAAEIKRELDSQGLAVNLRNVRQQEVGKGKWARKPKEPAPILQWLDSKEAYYFFDLQDFPALMNREDARITFISPIFNYGITEANAGQVPEYAQTFNEFVNFCNQQAKSSADDAYQNNWIVAVEQPLWNRATKRYEAKIIPIDDNGRYFNYGFKPGQQPAQETPLPTPKAPEPTPTPPARASTDELTLLKQQEATAKAQEAASIAQAKADLVEQFKAGKLSASELKELLNLL